MQNILFKIGFVPTDDLQKIVEQDYENFASSYSKDVVGFLTGDAPEEDKEKVFNKIAAKVSADKTSYLEWLRIEQETGERRRRAEAAEANRASNVRGRKLLREDD